MTIQPDLTVPEVARILRVAPVKVRRWIRGGELKATNTSDSKQRPCYVVTREALDAFRDLRSGAARQNGPSLPAVEQLV